MKTLMKLDQSSLLRIAVAGAFAGAMAIAATAVSAGECPADKKVADGMGQKPGPTAPKDVTDKVIASSDLSKDPIQLNGRLFRGRQLEVAPGGIVPWHDHSNRPAMIYMVSGEMTEYASTCAVPIVHKAGEITPEKAPTMHWWKNNGKTKAVLISVDLFPVEMKMDQHMM
jgi:quercetin dioxygenase-like cupin family protein